MDTFVMLLFALIVVVIALVFLSKLLYEKYVKKGGSVTAEGGASTTISSTSAGLVAGSSALLPSKDGAAVGLRLSEPKEVLATKKVAETWGSCVSRVRLDICVFISGSSPCPSKEWWWRSGWWCPSWWWPGRRCCIWSQSWWYRRWRWWRSRSPETNLPQESWSRADPEEANDRPSVQHQWIGYCEMIYLEAKIRFEPPISFCSNRYNGPSTCSGGSTLIWSL